MDSPTQFRRDAIKAANRPVVARKAIPLIDDMRVSQQKRTTSDAFAKAAPQSYLKLRQVAGPLAQTRMLCVL